MINCRILLTDDFAYFRVVIHRKKTNDLSVEQNHLKIEISLEIGLIFTNSSNLLQIEAVRDVICSEEGWHQVSDGTCFSTVRTELKGTEATFPTK